VLGEKFREDTLDKAGVHLARGVASLLLFRSPLGRGINPPLHPTQRLGCKRPRISQRQRLTDRWFAIAGLVAIGDRPEGQLFRFPVSGVVALDEGPKPHGPRLCAVRLHHKIEPDAAAIGNFSPRRTGFGLTDRCGRQPGCHCCPALPRVNQGNVCTLFGLVGNTP
jgi:hypothetical protein